NVQSKTRLGWVLLDYEVPAVRIVWRFAERFVLREIEADKGYVWLERTAKQWMPFIVGFARDVQLCSCFHCTHCVDNGGGITAQQVAANQQYEFAARVGSVGSEMAVFPICDRLLEIDLAFIH